MMMTWKSAIISFPFLLLRVMEPLGLLLVLQPSSHPVVRLSSVVLDNTLLLFLSGEKGEGPAPRGTYRKYDSVAVVFRYLLPRVRYSRIYSSYRSQ